MMQIIRLEHPKSGKGLFRAMYHNRKEYKTKDIIYNNLSFSYDLEIKHLDFPTPSRDNIKRTNHDYCAFLSINQLNEWIEKEWWSEIIGLGFRVYLITVSKWKQGNFQLRYQKRNIVTKEDITSLFL